MDETTFKRLCPLASRSTINLNVGLSEPKPKQNAKDALGASEKREGAGTNSARIGLRITGYRVSLLDPDGFAGSQKFLIDQIVRQGLIPDDSLKYITLTTQQIKAAHFYEEKTLVEIDYPE